MLLTITCDAGDSLAAVPPSDTSASLSPDTLPDALDATDLGYLLHKNPANVLRETRWFGDILVFYPEATPQCCTVALLLQIDPVGLIRGRHHANGIDQYVNDRPYVGSSLLSVALADVFGSALNGRCRERPHRVGEKLRLRASVSALSCANGDDLIPRLFAPLGYEVTTERATLDERFPAWGLSDVYHVSLAGRQTVQDLLTHLYVLIPALDNAKHYFVGEDEADKLLQKGASWLPAHPEKDLIARRYLRYKRTIVQDALDQLNAALPALDDTAATQDETDTQNERAEASAEAPLRLNDARMEAALDAIRRLDPPPVRVLDLGCGEGRLLRLILEDPALRGVRDLAGVDVAAHTLERAAQRLRLDRLPPYQRARLQLLQGSVVYRDDRFLNFDVALLIEVIEHLDAPRLTALEQVVFGHARPRRVVITTPNSEYNVTWESLPAGRFRHRDHRFEWTRAQFAQWTQQVATLYGYIAALSGIGPTDDALGSPTQMAVFDRQA